MEVVRLNFFMLAFLLVSTLLSGLEALAQPHQRSLTRCASFGSPEPDSEQFKHACYKIDAVLEPENLPLNFVTSPYQWDQPGGPGEPITVSYSYSNLLDGGIRGLTTDQLRQATEEALSIWATVAPINFIEVEDVGPDPTVAELDYSAFGSAQIRIGTHVMDGASGNELAHAYLPFSNSAGLAGDLHFDVDEDWGVDNGGFFLETMLHEIGHCLGLDHEDDVDAIMNSIIMNRFSDLESGYLLDDDVNGIQAIYGVGSGTVTPQEGPSDEMPTDDDEPTDGEPTDGEPTDEEPTDEETTDEEPTDDKLINDIVVERDTETGLLTLKGDSLDNSIFIYSPRWFTIVVGVEGTTINGKLGVFWWQTGDGAWDIVTSAGDDIVMVYGVRANNVRVDLGEGDDALAIIFSRLETFEAEGGVDEDVMLSLFSRIINKIESGFETVW